MAIELNHTIVQSRDQREAATFFSEIFGLPAPEPFGPFLGVKVAGVTFDFIDSHHGVESQHYAFLVGESEFDAIFGRIQARGLPYWADPMKAQAGSINHRHGGRGVYFEDPSGHFLEIITRPYAKA